MPKPFSLYIPRFHNTFSDAAVADAISLLLQTPHFRLKGKDYDEARKHPRIKKMLTEQRSEVYDWFWKQDALVDRLVGYAVSRIQRDHEGQAWEEEIDTLTAFAEKTKDKILCVAWRQAHGQRWRTWKDEKAEMDGMLDTIASYRRRKEWTQPWPVFFTGTQHERTLAPVIQFKKWEPKAKLPAVPEGY